MASDQSNKRKASRDTQKDTKKTAAETEQNSVSVNSSPVSTVSKIIPVPGQLGRIKDRAPGTHPGKPFTIAMQDFCLQAMQNEAEYKLDNDFVITTKDLSLFDTGVWLEDKLINFYIAMIVKRSQTPSTGNGTLPAMPSVFAYPSAYFSVLFSELAKNKHSFDVQVEEKLFDVDIILFPTCIDKHWRLIVVNNVTKSVTVYNSMRPTATDHKMVFILMKWLKLAHQKLFPPERPWPFYLHDPVQELPQQSNTDDCGVYLLAFADYISRGAALNFYEETDAAYFRKMQRYECITKTLVQGQD